MDNGHGLHKSERLCSRKAIDELFAGTDSLSLSAYPIRAVFRHTEEVGNRILVSVSKKRLRHAADRNRVKRQLREQYRLHKDILSSCSDRSGGMDIAFIWLTERLQPSDIVRDKMVALLNKMSQAVARRQARTNNMQSERETEV